MISHGNRWKYAFRAFFSLIFHGRIADDILMTSPRRRRRCRPACAATAVGAGRDHRSCGADARHPAARWPARRLPDGGSRRLSNAQIGAAVRDVHRGLPPGARHDTPRSRRSSTTAEGSTVTVDRRHRSGARQSRGQRRRRAAVPRRAASSRLGRDAAGSAAARRSRPHASWPRLKSKFRNR